MKRLTFSITGPTIFRVTISENNNEIRSVPFNRKYLGRVSDLLKVLGWEYSSWSDMKKD